MRHAGDACLDGVEPLLEELRTIGRLREKKRGVFSLGGRAALHFHEDPAGTYADVRLADDWERVPVTTPAEQGALVARVRAALEPPDA